MTKRCSWVSESEIYQAYHDQEWGKPQYNSQKLFEQLCLEGQQAGLSWITILKKREAYRQAFFNFQPEKIAQMTESDLNQLMQNPGLIRHHLKLQAIVKNARAYLIMQANGEDFSHFIWSFVQHQPQSNSVQSVADLPSYTLTSTSMSKALKKRGFVFVGETICYAFMQAVGLVNDHFNDCFCKKTKI